MFSSITGSALKGTKVLLPPLAEQRRIVDVMSAVDDAIEAAERLAGRSAERVGALRNLRSNLLTVLLSGEHEIPESYDELLEVAA